MKEKVTVYTTSFCPYCTAAKRLLTQKSVPFEEVDVTEDQSFDDLVKKTGMKTVPQIFFGEKLIGGYQELAELDQKGMLT